jgi:hypothetical protein
MLKKLAVFSVVVGILSAMAVAVAFPLICAGLAPAFLMYVPFYGSICSIVTGFMCKTVPPVPRRTDLASISVNRIANRGIAAGLIVFLVTAMCMGSLLQALRKRSISIPATNGRLEGGEKNDSDRLPPPALP